jgi:hypothetical protein
MTRTSKRVTESGFTLFEVILALRILGLISGAVYSISAAAMEATKATLATQAGCRRLEAFLKVTRDAFLAIPADGQVFLRIGKANGGAPVPEIVFREVTGVFGIPSLGGGELVLGARPRSDGSRAFALLRVPSGLDGSEAERFLSSGPWIPILPGVERVAWSFYEGGEWKEEWPEGSARPVAVRLQFDYRELPGSPIDVQFWVPPLAAIEVAPPPTTLPPDQLNPPPGPPPKNEKP